VVASIRLYELSSATSSYIGWYRLCRTTYRRLRSRRSIIPICGVRIVRRRAITVLRRSIRGVLSGKKTTISLQSGSPRPLHNGSYIGHCSLCHIDRQQDALVLEYCTPNWSLKGDIHYYQKRTDLGRSVQQRYAALAAACHCGIHFALPLWPSMRFPGPFHSSPSIFDCKAKGKER